MWVIIVYCTANVVSLTTCMYIQSEHIAIIMKLHLLLSPGTSLNKYLANNNKINRAITNNI